MRDAILDMYTFGRRVRGQLVRVPVIPVVQRPATPSSAMPKYVVLHFKIYSKL